MTNNFTTSAIILSIAILAWVLVLVTPRAYSAVFPTQAQTPTFYASSTPITLTKGLRSVQLIATSSRFVADTVRPETQGRSAVTLQPTNCDDVFLSFHDVKAASTTGFYLAASTTLTLGEDIPLVQGAIQAFASSIRGNGTCTINVTEFRTI